MNKIRVYKTNVEDKTTAKTILASIGKQFGDCESSFDLENCDNVLRIESKNGPADEAAIRKILQKYGYQIEKLI